MNRRSFLAAQAGLLGTASEGTRPAATPVDFRYAPRSYQTLYCFPDDPHKSLVGERGDLRIGHPGDLQSPIDYFTSIVEFSLAGLEPERVTSQRLESPSVPIVHTMFEVSAVTMEIITFATNRTGEGRVDNVILQLRDRGKTDRAIPLVTVSTRAQLTATELGKGRSQLRQKDGAVFLISDVPLSGHDIGHGYMFQGPAVNLAPDKTARLFFRLPKEGQSADRLQAGLDEPEQLLAEARAFWTSWRPSGGKIGWKLAGRYQEFMQACARNIQQAREVKQGRKTFQVGPTWYRGLWIVDGNFILEAARYLGLDEEAQQGLEATWAYQREDGGVFAAVRLPHWKDTGIAMFTLVRQAELSQDWTYFRSMVPNILRATAFLEAQRQSDGYRILAPGFGDGGLTGVKREFTNTIWALAGLRAVRDAAAKLGIGELEPVGRFYNDLRESYSAAARQEMRRHPAGFDFLPMLMKDDPEWQAPEEWDRPRLQVGQWAMAHAIYPGLIFSRDSAEVKGYLALMQAVTKEDVPTGTGWLPHGGLWTYDAGFAAHVYLWAGLNTWASRTFTGFLNHASRQYCWREEMPLRGSLTAYSYGDMPHNWASAECILYMRHMLALEDGSRLRLLSGMTGQELSQPGTWSLEESPTRFGRIDLKLQPLSTGWRLEFARRPGPQPDGVLLPTQLGSAAFSEVTGAKTERRAGSVLVDPSTSSWTCTWRTKA